MASTAATELEAFQRFLQEQIASGSAALSPEQSVTAFRAYQQELQRLRNALQPAIEESNQGLSRPLNIDAIKAQVTKRLADQGVTE